MGSFSASHFHPIINAYTLLCVLTERKSTLPVERELATPAPAFGIVFRLPIFLFLHEFSLVRR